MGRREARLATRSSIRLVVKTRPADQYPVSRELRERLKDAFDERRHRDPVPAAGRLAPRRARARGRGRPRVAKGRAYAARSSSSACRRAASSASPSAPSIRTSSPTTSSPRSSVDGRPGGRAREVLGDREVPRGERRDLRQVGDADDLARGGEVAQLLAHRAGRLPADAGVDLVEDERRPPPAPAAATPMSASMTRESSPPEAVSRSGPAGTPGFGAIRNSTASAPVGPGCALGERRSRRRRPPSPARRAARARPRRASAPRPSAPCAARSRRRRGLRRARCKARRRGLDRELGAGELGAPRAAALGVGEHAGDRAAVLALQALEHGQALLDAVQPARLGIQALGVAAQLAGEVVGLDGQRAPALAERVERRVDVARPEQPAAGGREQARDARLVGPRGLGRAERRAAQRLDVAQARRARRAGPAASSSLGSAASISASSNSSRSSSRSRAPARSRSSCSAASSVAYGGVRRRHLRPARELGLAAEAVEDLELGGREREPAVLVLAVEGDAAARRARAGRRPSPSGR